MNTQNTQNTHEKFAINALVTYRLTRLLTEDTILEPLREAAFNISPPSPHLDHTSVSVLKYVPNPTYILTCPHCAAPYAALAALSLDALADPSPQHLNRAKVRLGVAFAAHTLRSVLSLSAVTSLLNR